MRSHILHVLLVFATISCNSNQTNQDSSNRTGSLIENDSIQPIDSFLPKESVQLNWNLTANSPLKSGNTVHSTLNQYLWAEILKATNLSLPQTTAIKELSQDFSFINTLDTSQAIISFGSPEKAFDDILHQFKRKYRQTPSNLYFSGVSFVGYAYQKINAPFELAFEKGNMQFKKTEVKCISYDPIKFSDSENSIMNNQIQLLYYNPKSGEAIVKLVPNKGSYELYFSMIAKPKNFSEGYKKTKELIEIGNKEIKENHLKYHLNYGDLVQIPFIQFRQEHSFDELLNIQFNSKMNPIGYYQGTIFFKLDEKGFEIEEEFGATDSAAMEAVPKQIIFNKPFYTFVKLKNAKAPSMNLWIENTDLLVPSK